MRSAEVLGHAATLEGLWRSARGGRLAHALWFIGPAGVGKFLAAERLVLGLLCARGPGAPCLACGPCRRALSGSHPDVHVIDPGAHDSEIIPVGWITPREEGGRPPGNTTLEEFLALRPMEGGWRCALLRDAERLRPDAQNVLLKTLEEPGESVLFVLVSAAREDLLPTVRSRLVPVSFASLAPGEVEACLREARVPEPERADLARWSRGAPGRALDLRATGAAAARALLARVLAGELDPLEAAGTLAELPGEFSGKTPSARARARARAFLDLCCAVLGDGLRARAGAAPEGLAHGDLAVRMGGAEVVLEAALDRCLAARQDVDRNLDPAIAVERALLALAKARPRPSRTR